MVEKIIPFVKENGYEFSLEDLKKLQQPFRRELSNEELDRVAGGYGCFHDNSYLYICDCDSCFIFLAGHKAILINIIFIMSLFLYAYLENHLRTGALYYYQFLRIIPSRFCIRAGKCVNVACKDVRF